MTPGARGWIAVAVYAFVLVAFSYGYHLGARGERAKWDRWNYSHVVWDTKGDKANATR